MGIYSEEGEVDGNQWPQARLIERDRLLIVEGPSPIPSINNTTPVFHIPQLSGCARRFILLLSSLLPSHPCLIRPPRPSAHRSVTHKSHGLLVQTTQKEDKSKPSLFTKRTNFIMKFWDGWEAWEKMVFVWLRQIAISNSISIC